jgi:hypothetical protein
MHAILVLRELTVKYCGTGCESITANASRRGARRCSYRGAIIKCSPGYSLCPTNPAHSNPNRAKYLRSLSESLIVRCRDRPAPNIARPASAMDRDCRQTPITDSNCSRSKASSSLSVASGRRPLKLSLLGSAQCSRRRPISAVTNCSVIRPPSASVAIRVIAADSSRKLPAHFERP